MRNNAHVQMRWREDKEDKEGGRHLALAVGELDFEVEGVGLDALLLTLVAVKGDLFHVLVHERQGRLLEEEEGVVHEVELPDVGADAALDGRQRHPGAAVLVRR